MKVTIKAVLKAPGWLQYFGGTNPPVFTGEFVQNLSDSELRRLLNTGTVKVGSVVLQKETELNRNNALRCEGHLSCVTKRYFKRLQSQGWILNPEGVKRYGFPNDEADKRLKKHFEEQGAQIRLHRQLEKNLGLAHMRLVRRCP